MFDLRERIALGLDAVRLGNAKMKAQTARSDTEAQLIRNFIMGYNEWLEENTLLYRRALRVRVLYPLALCSFCLSLSHTLSLSLIIFVAVVMILVVFFPSQPCFRVSL